MNSRTRIIKAINHKEPDQVPIDLGATPSSGISAIAYHYLKKHLKIHSGATRVYDVSQQLAQPEDNILERFNVDVIDVGRAFNKSKEDWYETYTSHDNPRYDQIPIQYPQWFTPKINDLGGEEIIDSNNVILAKKSRTTTFFEQTHYPFLNGYPKDLSELIEVFKEGLWSKTPLPPFDHMKEGNFWAKLKERTQKLREETDKALVIGVGCNLFETGTFLRRMDKFLIDLIKNPDKVIKFLDILMDLHLTFLKKVCQYVGDLVDIMKFGDDLGENQGPFMSPKTYQVIFKPRHKELCDFVKENSSAHTMLHSCGSIYEIIPDLIEAGFDILNPVQINAKNMDPHKLKHDFGEEVTFWGGGADTRNVLNKANPKVVKKHVLELLEIFSQSGGYVFNQVHNILPEIPPENIVAMFQAVEEFNKSKR
ncbi:MAG: Methylcobalamin:coenzyme M methyltransferase [Promethearchaeota archaeon]|nr:MAG: Methylcobalamin:coenzyme M methyltransferase [Candidatus Lokiarchaeota archaeon]